MDAVFSYFFGIGSGLAAGIAAIVLPSIYIVKKFIIGGKKNVRKG